MRLSITLEDTCDGEQEVVFAGLAILRQWEQVNGKPALKEIDAGYVGPLLEIAAMAHNRKHGGVLDVDGFIDRYDIVGFKSASEGGTAMPPPFAAETVPRSD